MSQERQPPRITVYQSVTRKIQDDFEKTAFQAETELASGFTIEEGLRDLHATVQKALLNTVKGQSDRESGKIEHPEVPKESKLTFPQETVKVASGISPATHVPSREMQQPINKEQGQPKTPTKQTSLSVEPEWTLPLEMEAITGDTTRIKLTWSEKEKGDEISVGLVIIKHMEAIAIPARPFNVRDPALTGFLVRDVLERKVEEAKKDHREFAYQLVTENGLFKAVRARPLDNDERVKKFVNSVRWTFGKALTRNMPDRSQVGSPIR